MKGLKHKRFICLNGEMLPAGKPSIVHVNRAFCYGDALFETIHANGTKLQFFQEHYERLEKSMIKLRMKKSSQLEVNALESAIVRLLNKNHLYQGVRVRLTVFRNSGGFYTPETNDCSFLAETIPLPHDQYHLNEKGLKAGMFTTLRKHPDELSNLKTANSLIYIMAGLHKKEAGVDECIILNTHDRLAECISSNIFIKKGGTLYTPELDEGCVEGIMRSQIIRVAGQEGMECKESQISEIDLLQADEFFITNSITGIQWVVAYRQKRYFSKTARMLITSLNKEQFG